jgi:hypothetical protein
MAKIGDSFNWNSSHHGATSGFQMTNSIQKTASIAGKIPVPLERPHPFGG